MVVQRKQCTVHRPAYVCSSHLRGRSSFITILFNMKHGKNEAGNLLPKVFTFNPSNQPIRVEVINNEPWFIAKDLCDALELKDVSRAVEKLDDDEKLLRTQFVSGQKRQLWSVSESGMYALILRSDKPQAKPFRKWVTSEVLPSIRRTGSYKMEKNFSPRRPDFVDLRHIPYEYREFEKTHVRIVNFQDINWFSINDIFRCIGANSCSVTTARNINAANPGNAIKIFLYGNTHPAWFTTLTGAQLIISGSRKLKHNKQQANQIQVIIGGL